jgi:hypothetical protein
MRNQGQFAIMIVAVIFGVGTFLIGLQESNWIFKAGGPIIAVTWILNYFTDGNPFEKGSWKWKK